MNCSMPGFPILPGDWQFPSFPTSLLCPPWGLHRGATWKSSEETRKRTVLRRLNTPGRLSATVCMLVGWGVGGGSIILSVCDRNFTCKFILKNEPSLQNSKEQLVNSDCFKFESSRSTFNYVSKVKWCITSKYINTMLTISFRSGLWYSQKFNWSLKCYNATCLCLGEGHLTSPTAWIAFLFKRKQFQLWLIGQLGYNPFYRRTSETLHMLLLSNSFQPTPTQKTDCM